MLWEMRQFAVHIHGWIHIKIFFVDDFYRFFITGLYESLESHESALVWQAEPADYGKSRLQKL